MISFEEKFPNFSWTGYKFSTALDTAGPQAGVSQTSLLVPLYTGSSRKIAFFDNQVIETLMKINLNLLYQNREEYWDFQIHPYLTFRTPL